MKQHPIYAAAFKAWSAKPASAAYISTVDTAKLIRATLASKFPGVKFSVVSDKYAGGSSIRVRWTDGPTEAIVEAFTQPFAGAGFDGMIDMKFYKDAWLYPDGSASFGRTGGTEGSRGVYPAEAPEPTANGAIPVSFSADYVFVNRDYTAGALHNVLKAYAAKWSDELAEAIRDGKVEVVDDGFGAWIKNADNFDCTAPGSFHGRDGSRVLGQMARRRMLPAFMPKINQPAALAA